MSQLFIMFPYLLADLKSLDWFRCEHCQITQWPYVAESYNLRELQLVYNSISTLPNITTLGFPPNAVLRYLELSHNTLEAPVDPEIWSGPGFRDLVELKLTSCGIGFWPNLASSVNLKLLHLGDNAITEIPDDHNLPSSLIQLIISSNNVGSNFPSETIAENMNHLQILTLSYMGLTKLPYLADCSRSLKQLNIRSNPFQHLDSVSLLGQDSFSSAEMANVTFPLLAEIHMSSIELHNISETFFRLVPKLKELVMSGQVGSVLKTVETLFCNLYSSFMLLGYFF